MTILAEVREIVRHAAPGPEPLGLAFDGTRLWIASREAHRLYAIDRATWTVSEEVPAPGAPFGIAAGTAGFGVVVGYGEDDDDRYIYRFVPGRGFASDRIECPDFSGVQLAFEGDALFLAQAHNRRILALDEHGAIVREIRLDRVPVGMTNVSGGFYLITGDKAFRNLQLSKLDVNAATPRETALASIPFVARGLTFDGSCFWTGHRTNDEIVAFALPTPE